jgi:hypothetical protein
MIKKIKENFIMWKKLKNIPNRADDVWESLKKYHKENGINYGTYEKEKYIETSFSLDDDNKIVKRYHYFIDEKNDFLKSIIYISEGFDSAKSKDILILASHFNSLMSKGLIRVNTEKGTISMEYRISLIVPYFSEAEIHFQCLEHFNHSRDIVWAFNRLLISDEDPVFIMVDLMRKLEEKDSNQQK